MQRSTAVVPQDEVRDLSKVVPPGGLELFLELALRGYTTRVIMQRMEAEGYKLTINSAQLTAILLEITRELSGEREALDALTIEVGLGRKLERVRRLCEIAELVEARASLSPKWAGVYRRYLAQIQAELEPLNIEFNPGDKWAALMQRLADVDQSDVASKA